MDSSLRELAECTVGTQDFNVGLARDPKITLSRLDQATGASGAESEEGSPAERAASLYDAIREMSTYGSEIAAEKRGRDGDGRFRKP
ncbi:hypothetical protein ACFS5L_42530 [Streptomyces phyllanthi]|uniref:Uncharacterized protein n=1 Tax=Streptomyces phyllanthi TaxID=1803180 RepID=A0A5N8VYB3_9ACTN|nr:hypothetical protein [Streptomyces phyllanthi]MPY39028.1 hypothetical protein [Streptomyces phyllanthi]